MTRVRTVTLHQPYATLVALGVKRTETRSWPAPADAVGERLLIHASKRDTATHHASTFGPYTVRAGVAGGVLTTRWNDPAPVPLPLGAIVASATLTACVPMVAQDEVTDAPHLLVGPPFAENYLGMYRGREFAGTDPLDVSDQRAYGDFAPGRWAWLLDDIKPTTERCPACWGEGTFPPDPDSLRPDILTPCWTCRAHGVCDPVPARGRQRVWWWQP